MDIGRGDMPVVKGPFGMLALAPPRANTLARQLRPDALGLLVGVRLDIPAVGCDGNEPRVRAIIVDPLNEFAAAFGRIVGEGRIWHLRIERTVKFVARTESFSPAFAHANDVVRILLTHLADRVEPVLIFVALDPNLMPERPPNRRELFGIG